jgi:hypothetical protein
LKKQERFRRDARRPGLIGGALLLGTLVAAGLALVQPAALWAQSETSQPREFLVLATGGQEVPSVDSPGVAFGRLSLGADRQTLAYDMRISGLRGTFTGMHLHRGRVGQKGQIVYTLAEPVNGPSRGEVEFNAADEADLATQGFYLNISTDRFPEGEIRGQVVAAPVAEAPAEPQVSFTKEIRPIFGANCSCHIGRSAAEGMNLAAGEAYGNLVNVVSNQSDLNRVEPGDPARSYLIHKLRNTQRSVGGSGARMPFGGRALPEATIQRIEKWIAQGAQEDRQ